MIKHVIDSAEVPGQVVSAHKGPRAKYRIITKILTALSSVAGFDRVLTCNNNFILLSAYSCPATGFIAITPDTSIGFGELGSKTSVVARRNAGTMLSSNEHSGVLNSALRGGDLTGLELDPTQVHFSSGGNDVFVMLLERLNDLG